MKTLATYGKQLKKPLRHQYDPDGNITNLTKQSFSKTEYRILNKNLTFTLPQKYTVQTN